MADFKAATVRCGAKEPKAFEEQVRLAKESGYRMVAIDATTGPTEEQSTGSEDAWENYSILSEALFKIIETDLISGYFKKETYEANQEALRWKSEILKRHGMSASIYLLEPQWMPTPWYEGRPEVKGCRCDYPAVSRSAHYALNIDHEKVLKHYYQLAGGIIKLAPATGRFSIWTNDSGAGINWCAGLYPGPNGPAETKDRDMGERVQTWFQAMRDGSKAAGREVIVDLRPNHFTPDEIRSTARALRPPSRLICDFNDPKNHPFPTYEIVHLQGLCKGTKTPVLVNVDFAGGYHWKPMVNPPLLYLAGEILMELKGIGVRGLDSGLMARDSGVQEPLAMMVERCMGKCPASMAELEAAMQSVAEDLAGKKYADALIWAWRDVDHAIRALRLDYGHGYYFFYSILGGRWLTRPFVPVPEALNDEELSYWSACVMKSRNSDRAIRRVGGRGNYAVNYDGLEMAGQYFNRAVKTLDAALRKAGKKAKARAALKDQRDRIDMFGCLFRCQLHATGVQWVLDRFAGKPDADRWAQPKEKKRLYAMIDGEIENCRRMIKLLKKPVAPLLNIGKEAAFSLPENVAGLLEKKIEVMKRHRSRVEEVFPGVVEKGHVALTYSEDGGVITAEEAKKQLEKPGDKGVQSMRS